MRRTRARYILRTTETRRPARDGEVLVEATNHSADLGWLGLTALTASTIFLMALFLSRPAVVDSSKTLPLTSAEAPSASDTTDVWLAALAASFASASSVITLRKTLSIVVTDMP